jgi:hypothetical protein
VAQGVDGGVDLRTFAALVPVPAGPRAALQHALQRAAVEDRRARLAAAPGRQAQQRAQVGGERRDDARLHQAAGLGMHDVPGGQVVGQPAPGGASAHDPASRVEDLAQGVAALRRVLAHQRQVGGDEGPFLVADVALIGLAGGGEGVHPRMLSPRRHRVHNKL